MLNCVAKFCLCAVLFVCAGCGSNQRGPAVQVTPEQASLQSEKCRGTTYVDAYPENWEHALSQRALAAR